MEITGALAGNVTNVQLKADNTNDGQQVIVDFTCKLTQEVAKQRFGEPLQHVAFACLRRVVESNVDGDETVHRFGYSSKKAPKWLRPSLHVVDLWGNKQRIQPEIRKIIAGDNEAAVTVHLRFVFDANEDEALIGSLGAKSGKQVKVKLKPVQVAALPRQPSKAA